MRKDNPRATTRLHFPHGFSFQQVQSKGESQTSHTDRTQAKAVPLYATKAPEGRGSIAPTHSRPRH
jgi:hypothetical protein